MSSLGLLFDGFPTVFERVMPLLIIYFKRPKDSCYLATVGC